VSADNFPGGPSFFIFFSQIIIHLLMLYSYVWVNDSTLLVSTVPPSRGDPPMKPLVPFGLRIRSNEQRNIIQMRSTKEMLKDLHEEELFDYYATSQLVLVLLDGTVKPIALRAIYTSLDASPDEKYLMLTSVHRPYSSIVSYKRFLKKVELWTIDGRFVCEVCDLPLAEDIPVAANSVRKGKSSIRWRPDMPFHYIGKLSLSINNAASVKKRTILLQIMMNKTRQSRSCGTHNTNAFDLSHFTFMVIMQR
jgi:hypothetical protein